MQYLLFPVLLSGMFFYLLVTPMERAVGAGERAGFALAGLGLGVVAVSILWTRVACRRFLVPKRGGGTEEINLSRTDAARVGL